MTHHQKSIVTTFLSSLFLLSLPLWAAAYFIDISALVPINLPLSALQFLVVPLAAFIAQRRHGKRFRPLLYRITDINRVKNRRHRVAVFLIMPLIVWVAFLIATAGGSSAASTPIASLGVFMVLYSLSAYCEELGWTAIMADHLLKRYGFLVVGTMVGISWAAWHFLPFLQTGNTIEWVLWQSIFTVVFRILIVRIYMATGLSMSGSIALHATYNVAFSFLPYYGSTYSPMLMTLITTAALLLIVWYARSSNIARA